MFLFQELSLEEELQNAVKSGTFEKYRRRATGESKLYLLGEACGWDRETMIQLCLDGISGWLGREVFETSFDDGSMKEHAKIYHEALMAADK